MILPEHLKHFDYFPGDFIELKNFFDIFNDSWSYINFAFLTKMNTQKYYNFLLYQNINWLKHKDRNKNKTLTLTASSNKTLYLSRLIFLVLLLLVVIFWTVISGITLLFIFLLELPLLHALWPFLLFCEILSSEVVILSAPISNVLNSFKIVSINH